MTDLASQAAAMSADIKKIDESIDRLVEHNKRMRALLAQAALFIACQPENRFRAKWLKDAEALIDG